MLKGLSLSYNWDAYKCTNKVVRYSVSQKELQEVKLSLAGRWREGPQDRKNWLVTRRIHRNDMKIRCHTTGDAVFWHIGPHNMYFVLQKMLNPCCLTYGPKHNQYFLWTNARRLSIFPDDITTLQVSHTVKESTLAYQKFTNITISIVVVH